VGGAIRALVLAPTRELTAQIKAEAVKLLSPHGNSLGVQVSHLWASLSVLFCFGGVGSAGPHAVKQPSVELLRFYGKTLGVQPGSSALEGLREGGMIYM
jgi:hypothetical protein